MHLAAAEMAEPTKHHWQQLTSEVGQQCELSTIQVNQINVYCFCKVTWQFRLKI